MLARQVFYHLSHSSSPGLGSGNQTLGPEGVGPGRPRQMSHPFERGEEQRKIRKTVSPEKQPQSETVKKKKLWGLFLKVMLKPLRVYQPCPVRIQAPGVKRGRTGGGSCDSSEYSWVSHIFCLSLSLSLSNFLLGTESHYVAWDDLELDM
jgi:hypothetical protein